MSLSVLDTNLYQSSDLISKIVTSTFSHLILLHTHAHIAMLFMEWPNNLYVPCACISRHPDHVKIMQMCLILYSSFSGLLFNFVWLVSFLR